MVDEARALGYETYLLPVGRLRQLGRRWSVIRSIARLARERKVSMVFGWMVASQTMAGPAAWLAGVPAAWYQVGLAGPDWLDRLATLLPACGILVLSKDCAVAQARVWPRRPQRLVYPGCVARAVRRRARGVTGRGASRARTPANGSAHRHRRPAAAMEGHARAHRRTAGGAGATSRRARSHRWRGARTRAGLSRRAAPRCAACSSTTR